MASFKTFDLTELKAKFPSTAGRLVSKPSVAVQANGRIQFSTMVSEALAGMKVAVVGFDEEGNRVAITGYAEPKKGQESKFIDLLHPKANKKDGKVKSKSISITGVVILKAIGYDYKKAGNQTFEVEKYDVEKHVVVFALPKVTPTAKPKVVREKKVKAPVAAAASATNGAPVPSAATGGDDLQVDV